MNYKILETHVVYENDKIKELAVLWDDNGSVRATYSNPNPMAGYVMLKKDDNITPDLMQRVAGGGSYLDDERKKKYFPGNRNWSR